jgi:hypothetical protein
MKSTEKFETGKSYVPVDLPDAKPLVCVFTDDESALFVYTLDTGGTFHEWIPQGEAFEYGEK